MDQAIRTLRQRFTQPSTELVQRNPLCRICWTNYEGGDRPVRLPCGHVFGEKCIITWSRRVTPTGRYNGCPFCGAELLPPSLQSRTSVLCDWLVYGWRVLRAMMGGRRQIALVATLWVTRTYAESWPESKIAGYVALGTHVLLTQIVTRRAARLVGWKWANLVLVIALMMKFAAASSALAKPALVRSGFVKDQAR